MRGDYFAPVCTHGLAQQGDGLCGCRAVGEGMVVVNAGRWMDEVVIRTQMQMIGVVESRECEAKGIRMQ